MNETRTPSMPSRRAVAKAAAWSAPVIAATVAAPMAAASTNVRTMTWSQDTANHTVTLTLAVSSGTAWAAQSTVTVTLSGTGTVVNSGPSVSGVYSSQVSGSQVIVTLLASIQPGGSVPIVFTYNPANNASPKPNFKAGTGAKLNAVDGNSIAQQIPAGGWTLL